MRSFHTCLTLLLAISLLLTGCAPGTSGVPSQTAADTTAGVDDRDTETFAPAQTGEPEDGAAVFSAALLQRAAEPGENTVISPLSAYLALAMAARGAGGNTLAQMEQVLGADVEKLCAFAAEETARLTAGGAELSLANSVWVDEGFSVSADYADDLETLFSAESFSCRLSSGETMQAINRWCEEHTKGLIPKLLEQPLSGASALALINALYLKADWQTPFEARNTMDKPFTKDNGETVSVPTMSARTGLCYYELPDGGKGVVLPYADCDLAFVAILPPQGMTGADYAASMAPDAFYQCVTEGETQKLELELPKFTAQTTLIMNQALIDMGMSDAFSQGEADFSAMCGQKDDELFLGTALQKVKLTVDEKGTEAAAASAVVMFRATAIADQATPLHFDRSFVYGVIDTQNGIPLFSGVEAAPEK
ncbi:MAG: serpin family protein [Faecousia sp.]